MKIQYLIIFLLFSSILIAQNPKNTVKPTPLKAPISSKDSLFLVVIGQNRYILHKVKKGENLQTLCKSYNIDNTQIQKNNPEIGKKEVKENQLLRISIPLKALVTERKSGFDEKNYTSIFYRVATKETLYNIAKNHLKTNIDTLQKRNKLKTLSVNNGQVLHLGWFPKNGIPDSLKIQKWMPEEMSADNLKLKKKFEEQKSLNRKEFLQEGKSTWPKYQPVKTGKTLSVLFNQAPEGAIVRIENPMTKRSLYAKVIGKVPDTAFARDSVVILSSTLAETLGILDEASFVKVYYLK
jgi:hypothetical protein